MAYTRRIPAPRRPISSSIKRTPVKSPSPLNKKFPSVKKYTGNQMLTPGGRAAFPTAARPTHLSDYSVGEIRSGRDPAVRQRYPAPGFAASVGDTIMMDGVEYTFTGTGWEQTSGFGNLGYGGSGAMGGGYPESPGYAEPEPPPEAKFSAYDAGISGAPAWWKGMTPDIINANSEYQTLANLMIPFLSPEDQLTVASQLFQSDEQQFAHLNPESIGREGLVTQPSADIATRFLSGGRASDVLNSFDRLLEVAGKEQKDFGPGYTFLRGLADTVEDFKLTSGAMNFTEAQYAELLAALDPQLAQTENNQLSAFGPLSRAFTSPFFSGGSLTGRARNKFGDVVPVRNRRWF